MGQIAQLPRAWWFPELEGYRSSDDDTYLRHELDEQPRLGDLDEDLSWLEGLPTKAPAIDRVDGGYQSRPLTAENLESLTAGLPLPRSLLLLGRRQDLQRRIRSATACYLDLADFVVPTSNPDGHLLHFLSDQQWIRHWLVYLCSDGTECVVTSGEPVGFTLDDDWEDPPPNPLPLDGSFDLEVCADSFVEFLYRYWIENELFFAIDSGRSLSPVLAGYARRLPVAE